MRRPLVFLFLFYTTGVLTAFYNGKHFLSFFLLAFLSGTFFLFFGERERRRTIAKASILLLLCAFLSGFLSMKMEEKREEPLLVWEGENAFVCGKIVSVKEYDRLSILIVKETTEGFLSPRKIRVEVSAPFQNETSLRGKYSPGMVVEVNGEVERPNGRRNPGGFDQKLYLRTMGIQAIIVAKVAEVRQIAGRVAWHAVLRSSFEEKLQKVLDPYTCAGFSALLFGDKSGLEEETLKGFQRVGIGHLLAVSGLHVGLVYLTIQKLIGKRRSWKTDLFSLLLIFAYAGLSGYSPSVMRAAFMITLQILARRNLKAYDMSSAASLAGLLLFVRQPYQVFDGGLQLSFLAAFGLSTVLPRIAYSLERLADFRRSERLRNIGGKVAPLLAVQLVMVPLCAGRFHSFSIWSFLLNPVYIAVAGFIIPLGLLLFVLSFLAPPLPSILFSCVAKVAGALTRGMLLSGRTAGKLPGTFLTSGPPPGAMILYYGLLFLLSSESFPILLKRGKRRTAVVTVSLLFFFANVLPWSVGLANQPHIFSREVYSLGFIDVGQGDCLHIRTPKGKNLLIDGGGSLYRNTGEKVLLPYLLSTGVKKIDLALLTHLHTDHYKGIQELSFEMPIKELGLYESNRFREKEIWKELSGKIKPVYLVAGQRIAIEEGIFIEVLAPPARTEKDSLSLLEKQEDENLSSLIFRVHYHGISILMTGDMGFEGEATLIEALKGKEEKLSAHVLKIGHHGSKYSTSEVFLQAVNPKFAVIQVGKNNFGHPSARVFELLTKYSIMTSRTDLYGGVFLKEMKEDAAEFIDATEEHKWLIKLQKTRNMPTKKSKKN